VSCRPWYGNKWTRMSFWLGCDFKKSAFYKNMVPYAFPRSFSMNCSSVSHVILPYAFLQFLYELHCHLSFPYEFLYVFPCEFLLSFPYAFSHVFSMNSISVSTMNSYSFPFEFHLRFHICIPTQFIYKNRLRLTYEFLHSFAWEIHLSMNSRKVSLWISAQFPMNSWTVTPVNHYKFPHSFTWCWMLTPEYYRAPILMNE